MNISAPYRYQIKSFCVSVSVYYSVIVLISVASLILALFLPNGTVGMNIDISGFIFIFIFALNSFKENFFFFSQNGVSRKNFFASRLLVMLSSAAIMAAGDQLLYALFSLLKRDNFLVNSIYEISGIGFTWAVVLAFAACLSFHSIGNFITLVFYRLGTFGKVLVGAGVPILILLIIPVVDNFLFNGTLMSSIWGFMVYIFAAPERILLMLLADFVIFMTFSWLLMRRAVVKYRA